MHVLHQICSINLAKGRHLCRLRYSRAPKYSGPLPGPFTTRRDRRQRTIAQRGADLSGMVTYILQHPSVRGCIGDLCLWNLSCRTVCCATQLDRARKTPRQAAPNRLTFSIAGVCLAQLPANNVTADEALSSKGRLAMIVSNQL